MWNFKSPDLPLARNRLFAPLAPYRSAHPFEYRVHVTQPCALRANLRTWPIRNLHPKIIIYATHDICACLCAYAYNKIYVEHVAPCAHVHVYTSMGESMTVRHGARSTSLLAQRLTYGFLRGSRSEVATSTNISTFSGSSNIPSCIITSRNYSTSYRMARSCKS
jgi:hypothetical protein